MIAQQLSEWLQSVSDDVDCSEHETSLKQRYNYIFRSLEPKWLNAIYIGAV